MTQPTFDVTVNNLGTLHAVTPETPEAGEWLAENTNGTWAGGSLMVEPRYTVDLLLGMQDEGFTVPLAAR